MTFDKIKELIVDQLDVEEDKEICAGSNAGAPKSGILYDPGD